jgi:hypothetical protein
LESFTTVNITVLGNVTGGQQKNKLYWDPAERNLTESTVGVSNPVELAIGESVENERSTTTATRVVRLNGQDVVVRVVVS